MLLTLSVIAWKVNDVSDLPYIQEAHGVHESRVVSRVLDKAQTAKVALHYELGLRKQLNRTSAQSSGELD